MLALTHLSVKRNNCRATEVRNSMTECSPFLRHRLPFKFVSHGLKGHILFVKQLYHLSYVAKGKTCFYNNVQILY